MIGVVALAELHHCTSSLSQPPAALSQPPPLPPPHPHLHRPHKHILDNRTHTAVKTATNISTQRQLSNSTRSTPRTHTTLILILSQIPPSTSTEPAKQTTINQKNNNKKRRTQAKQRKKKCPPQNKNSPSSSTPSCRNQCSTTTGYVFHSHSFPPSSLSFFPPLLLPTEEYHLSPIHHPNIHQQHQ